MESDATSDGGVVYSLGAKEGSSPRTGLLRGDAFVSTTKGHIVLFERYNGIDGIWAIEQTPNKAVRETNQYRWEKMSLDSYRPIRRNKVNDYNYVFSNRLGVYGQGQGEFDYPQGIAVSPFGYIYVADTNNDRIQSFFDSGYYLPFVTEWGSGGSGNGQFNSPMGMAIDSSGYIYVADAGNNRIQKFSPNGAFIRWWGSTGYGNGQFNAPVAVAVDSSSYVYVVDRDNHRIQKFDNNGNFITKWGAYEFWKWAIQFPKRRSR